MTRQTDSGTLMMEWMSKRRSREKVTITSTIYFKLEVKSHACFSVTDLNIKPYLVHVFMNNELLYGVRTFLITDASDICRSGLLY